MSVNINISLDQDELIDSLSDGLTRRELVQFVKDLDAHQQDWDFTMQVYEHFKALHVDFLRELEEDNRRRERCPRAAGSSCVGSLAANEHGRCTRCDRLWVERVPPRQPSAGKKREH